MPPRTFKDITTPREIPQIRYIKTLRHHKPRSNFPSHSTREPQRAPGCCQHPLTASSYRPLFQIKKIPKSIRKQIAQIKQTGIVE